MRALAALSVRSASATSGRRSTRSDGRPGVTAGSVGIASARGIENVDGSAPTSTAISSSIPARSPAIAAARARALDSRPEEHTSELQSLMRISYAVFWLTKKKQLMNYTTQLNIQHD